jgi:hypothetical protein
MQQKPDDIDIDLTSKNGIQGTEGGFWNAECGIRKREASSRIDGGSQARGRTS